MNKTIFIEQIVQRQRAIVLAGLTALTALSWIYLVRMTGSMQLKACCVSGPYGRPWDAADLTLLFMMWTVMMIAMMLPSVSPVVIMFAELKKKRGEQNDSLTTAGLFLLGYLLAWTGFSALSALTQWGLNNAALLSPAMGIDNRVLGGSLLFAAGVFQWTPLKYACLTRCRSPLGFLMNEWREGPGGSIIMGLRHGMYCVGCCWLLMALMFVVGAMNLLWMAIITVFVLLEKILPGGVWISRASGLLLAAWGIWMGGGSLIQR